MMAYKNSFRFIDELENMVHSINMTPHSSLLNIAPAEFIAERDLYSVWAHYHMTHLKRLPKALLGPNVVFKFQLGQSVRISRLRSALSKGYDGKFSNEIFTVVARRHARPPSYELQDIEKQPVEGQFYEPELIAVNDRTDQEYMVDKIIRRFTDPETKKRMAIVNWVGWPKKHTSVIPEDDIVLTSWADGGPFAPSESVAAPTSPRAGHTERQRDGVQTSTLGMTLRPRHGRRL